MILMDIQEVVSIKNAHCYIWLNGAVNCSSRDKARIRNTQNALKIYKLCQVLQLLSHFKMRWQKTPGSAIVVAIMMWSCWYDPNQKFRSLRFECFTWYKCSSRVHSAIQIKPTVYMDIFFEIKTQGWILGGWVLTRDRRVRRVARAWDCDSVTQRVWSLTSVVTVAVRHSDSCFCPLWCRSRSQPRLR